jgi:phosphoglycerol transferase MdoB-like AlkP superfamily enzyme
MKSAHKLWLGIAASTSIAAALCIGASQFIWKHYYSCFDECDPSRHNYFDLIVSLFGIGIVLLVVAFVSWAVFVVTRMRYSERTASKP